MEKVDCDICAPYDDIDNCKECGNCSHVCRCASQPKPLTDKIKSLKIEKSTVKIKAPQNSIGRETETPIPKEPDLIYYDECSEFSIEEYKKILELLDTCTDIHYLRKW